MPHLSFLNSYRILRGKEDWQNHSAGSWTTNHTLLGDGRGRWTPFYCHPVFEGSITWPPIVIVPFPQLYSLILGHRFSLHKGSGFTPFLPVGGLIAIRNYISVLLGWIPFSCFPRTTGCFYRVTTLLWKSHCTFLPHFWGQGVSPIHFCVGPGRL